MRLIRLQDDEAGIGIGMFGGSSRLTEPIGAPRGSRHQEAAQLLALRIGVEPVQLLGDRIAGDLRHAADRDLADFAFAMNVQQLDRALPSHVDNSNQT